MRILMEVSTILWPHILHLTNLQSSAQAMGSERKEMVIWSHSF